MEALAIALVSVLALLGKDMRRRLKAERELAEAEEKYKRDQENKEPISEDAEEVAV